MYIQKNIIQIYLYDIESLTLEIDLLKKEIEIYKKEKNVIHPLKASTISDMPKSENKTYSSVENYYFKQNQYLTNLANKEIHLRALHIAIKIVLSRLKPIEKDVYNFRKNKITFEKISENLNKSTRYIQSISSKIINNIYDNYLEHSKALT